MNESRAYFQTETKKAMKACKGWKPYLSPAAWLGLLSLLAAALLLFLDVRLVIIPLAAFLLLNMVAPFCPRFSFYLPVVSRGSSGKKAVALTFDDGPDPSTTPALLKLLLTYQVQATFFVTGKNAAQYPELIKSILAQGHTIGNHSYSHNSLVFFKSTQTIIREIESTQKVLAGFGVRPQAFRPPVGLTSPRLGPALWHSGLYLINFSCRAFDGGNRRMKNLSEKILNRVRPDDIILLHDSKPPSAHLVLLWLKEIEQLFMGLAASGLAVLPLSELIGKPVMRTTPGGDKKEK
jgi:peptidoglycan-N-acetylglucosamine deacetylase